MGDWGRLRQITPKLNQPIISTPSANWARKKPTWGVALNEARKLSRMSVNIPLAKASPQPSAFSQRLGKKAMKTETGKGQKKSQAAWAEWTCPSRPKVW